MPRPVPRAKARELEQLFGFGRAVSGALDLYALHAVLERQLPRVTEARDALRMSGGWETLAHTHPGRHPLDETTCERLARETLTAIAQREEPPGTMPIEMDDPVCFPLIVGDEALSVLGVVSGAALGDSRRRIIAAAAAFVAIGVKNVELVRAIREHGLRDDLTGCYNRSHALETIDL
jgi:hypothetical protein